MNDIGSYDSAWAHVCRNKMTSKIERKTPHKRIKLLIMESNNVIIKLGACT